MLDRYPSLSVNWSYPTAVRFGPGRIKELPQALAAAGIKKPLFVTDPGLVDSADRGQGARRSSARRTSRSSTFSKVDGNPTLRNLYAGLAAFRAGKHDGVIAFGGGSAMDIGKLVAFMSGQTRPVFDFEDREDWWTRADGDAASRRSSPCRRPPAPAPRSAAPRWSPIPPTTPRRSSSTRRCCRRVVIADPELTLDLPAKITAWTGMDALSHSPGILVQPVLPPDGRGDRAGGPAPLQGVAAGRGQGRPQHRGARLHARRLVDGRGRLPEGPRRACTP